MKSGLQKASQSFLEARRARWARAVGKVHQWITVDLNNVSCSSCVHFITVHSGRRAPGSVSREYFWAPLPINLKDC
jgi:hypothetical protein